VEMCLVIEKLPFNKFTSNRILEILELSSHNAISDGDSQCFGEIDNARRQKL
jgi:hypothetical protein